MLLAVSAPSVPRHCPAQHSASLLAEVAWLTEIGSPVTIAVGTSGTATRHTPPAGGGVSKLDAVELQSVGSGSSEGCSSVPCGGATTRAGATTPKPLVLFLADLPSISSSPSELSTITAGAGRQFWVWGDSPRLSAVGPTWCSRQGTADTRLCTSYSDESALEGELLVQPPLLCR